MLDLTDQYVGFLQCHKHKLFHCRPYPGNSGDELIRKGTIKLLSDLGINTTAKPDEAGVILYPGGCPTMYSQVMAGICETLETFRGAELVVGPATFQFGYSDWVEVFNGSSTRVAALFARDPNSFANLQRAKLCDNIEIGLSHDPALYLRDTEWLKDHKAAATNEYVLAAFRHDDEMMTGIEGKWIKNLQSLLSKKTFKKLTHWAKKRARQRRAHIASKLADSKLPLKEVDVSGLDFDNFVRMIRNSKEVHTDRLHTMILAAMLGKPVFAYETSHQKLEGVYEQSLKDWANVTFISLRGSEAGGHQSFLCRQ